MRDIRVWIAVLGLTITLVNGLITWKVADAQVEAKVKYIEQLQEVRFRHIKELLELIVERLDRIEKGRK